MTHLSGPLDSVNLVALSLLPVSWWRSFGERFRAGDSPGDVFDRLLAERCPGEPGKPAELRSRAAAALARAAARDIAPILWSDAAYPLALSAIIDPPPVLWLRGQIAALEAPAVAIVGSRAATPYGLAVGERLAADLAARGVIIVSGLARGVDSAAHRGCAFRAAGFGREDRGCRAAKIPAGLAARSRAWADSKALGPCATPLSDSSDEHHRGSDLIH